jgi:hypothetical protein
VLPRAGLRDEPRLPEASRDQRLADGVVHLVGARVQEVLALEIDARAAEALRQPPCEVEPRRSSGVVTQPGVEFAREARVATELAPGLLELEQGRHEGLGDVAAAELPEVPLRVRQLSRSG